MKRVLLVLAVLFLFTAPVYAAEEAPAAPVSIDQMINDTISPVATWASDKVFYAINIRGQDVPLIILWLMAIGLFTTFYYGFANIRFFKLTLGLLAGKHQSEEGRGQISNWQALSTSLSSTVGLGNIAGVAIAISLGGPGATVWMILMGLFGMSTKFVECALGIKYRQINKDGVASGGPMYYLSKGFADRGFGPLGKGLAIFFAICAIGGSLGGGNMFQANQSYAIAVEATGGQASFLSGQGWLFGIILAVRVGMAIIGGIRSIARVAEKIFPTMAGIYLLAALTIILFNINQLPDAVMVIIEGAFNPTAAAGGLLGVMVAGVQRAVFSNESGIGSAAITYAAVKSDSHIGQGLISMLNPFIDTVIICTLTALVISITGVYSGDMEAIAQSDIKGILLTARAFATLGDWTIYWLAISVFLFAYSTLIAWYYIGEKGLTYLVGRGKNDSHVIAFKVFYCSFTVIGAAANLSAVIAFTDAMIFAMAIPNVIALYVMAPEIKKDLQQYLKGIGK